MKKVGIVTLDSAFNYGNRLQNYALQQALQAIGYEAVTIVSDSRVKRAKRWAKKLLGRLPLGQRFRYWRMLAGKEKVFTPFSAAYIATSKNKNPNEYHAVISGSDQVWNPRFAGKDFYFLTFVPKEKRFAYAASFGVSEIPAEHRSRFSKNLRGFNRISVREEDGKRMVEELAGRNDVIVVPDPTMLLTRSDWDAFTGNAKPKNAPAGKYIVVYALHDFAADNRARIKAYARENGYEIYQIMGDRYNSKYNIPDPREFVWLIAHAEAVFTDSFHCCVFSIIYRRPFIVFERTDGQKMSSRIETLTKKFGLEQAKAGDGADFTSILQSEDFRNTDRTLAGYREVGMSFLKITLGKQG